MVQADKPFRLRLEVEHGEVNESAWQRLQVRRNKGAWQSLTAENFPQPAKELELDFATPPDQSNGQGHWQFVLGEGSALAWQREEESQKEKGYLHVNASAQKWLALAAYETHWQPVEFAVDMRIPKEVNRPAGVVFAYNDEFNYARVDIEPGVGLHLVQVHAGVERHLASHPFKVPLGMWTELKIILEDDHVVVEYAERKLQEGVPKKEAFILAARKMFVPVVAATFTGRHTSKA